MNIHDFFKICKELSYTEHGSCLLIAAACVPITAYTIFFVSDSRVLDVLMILLNVVMFILAFAGGSNED